jgi:hypothetical protein
MHVERAFQVEEILVMVGDGRLVTFSTFLCFHESETMRHVAEESGGWSAKARKDNNQQ